jgi:hypothetical protein
MKVKQEIAPGPIHVMMKFVRRIGMTLDQELQTYRKALPKLLPQEGKFALVHGTEIAGTYGTYEDALQAGYDRFGLEPFLVKQVQAVERVQFLTRDVVPACRT